MNPTFFPISKKLNRILAIVVACIFITGTLLSVTAQNVKAAAPELLSYRKTVHASSELGLNYAERAVDGNINTAWASYPQMDPQWIYVDLGVTSTISRVDLTWEADPYAKAYQLQFSNDAENWTSIYSTTNGIGGTSSLTVSGKGRYVRVYCTERGKDRGYALIDFSVYGIPDSPLPAAPANIALNKTAVASTMEQPSWAQPGQLSASKAVDGDKTTRWSSEAWDPQWIYVDLGSVHTVGRVVLSWENAYGKTYDIQVSNDAQNWTTIYRELYGNGGINDIKLYGTGRYVRMLGAARGIGYGYSLYEFEVYDYVQGEPIPPAHIPAMPTTQIVNVGSGSYKTGDLTCVTPTYPLYKTENLQSPIPSSGWWQSILFKRLSDSIIPLPLRSQYTDQGLSVMNPGEGYVKGDNIPTLTPGVGTAGETDFYVMAGNINPDTMSAEVCDYSDWSVSSILTDNSVYKLKTTFVKGSPYIFNEFSDPSSAYIKLNAATSIFNGTNTTILATEGASVITDYIGLEVANTDAGGNTRVRSYGIFAPPGTVFTRTGKKITLQLGSGQNYLSIATLPSKNSLNYYYQHAYAFVTGTKVSYHCDDASSTVTTTFNVTTELKRSGFSASTLMCLFPHQWKASGASLTNLTYPSVRGTLKVFEGNSFSTQNKFTGIVPQFAEPTGSGSYNRANVISYINTLLTTLDNNYMWNDPYWEGKNLHPLAQAAQIADQLGETALRDRCLTMLRSILTDWYTYSGGWPNDYPYYLYYTPEWGTMMADGGNNGMAKWLSDHHYVWGYFIYASAVLATYDKDFMNNYGGIVEHLIKDIGNPSRTDSMYPFVREFDPYEGHSWAGGYADNYDGNNEEAASENLYAYAGQYLWGLLTGNAAYRDTGMWMYTVESNAVLQYWFNYDQDNWISGYPHGVVGQVWGSENRYGTYFSTDPNCIYGIHWLPVAPYMTYFGLQPDKAARVYNSFLQDKGSAENGWYHIIWPFQALSNPSAALAKWDPEKIRMDDGNGYKEVSNTYWFMNTLNALGTRTPDIRSSNWTSYQVFKKGNTYTACIWNPTNVNQYVVFRNASGAIVGTVTVPPMKTINANPVNGVQPPAPSGNTGSPTFLTPGGTYTSAQWVEIANSTAGATIRYTLDGTEPSAASAIYTSPIYVDKNTTIKAKAFKELMNPSNTVSAAYVLAAAGKTAAPVITPATGTYSGSQSVTISSSTSGAAIRYTTDGSTPTQTNGTVYTGPFSVLATTTIKAVAYKSGLTDSDVSTSVITIGTAPVSSKIEAENYIAMSGVATEACGDTGGGQNVGWIDTGDWMDYTVNTAAAGTYTVDFRVKGWSSAAQIQLKQGSTLLATISASTGDIWSTVTSAPFTLPAGTTTLQVYASGGGFNFNWMEFKPSQGVPSQAAAPVITPGTGTYSGAQSVSITSATSGATVKYTTDGSQPSQTNGTVYNGAFTVSTTTTVKAMAFKPGMTDSDITGATLTITAPSGNLALNKAVVASSFQDGLPASNAVDGNADTRWGSNWSDAEWIYVDLGSSQPVSKIILKWEGAYGKAYQIQVSDDAQKWTEVASTATGDGNTDEISFTAANARYVKLNGIQRATEWGYSLWEFEVYR